MKIFLAIALVLAAELCPADFAAAKRGGCYEAWLAARDADFLGDQPRVTITAAEYAALTNGMERLRVSAELRRKARETARRNAEKRAAAEAEERRARGLMRVRDIRRAREDAKKGAAK